MNKVFLTILSGLFILSSLNAQVMLKIEGDAFDFSEAGAIITEEDGNVTVVLAMEQMRPKVYKDLDIKKGDVIFMANGQKIKTVKQIEEIYQTLEIGGEFKVAVKRDGKPVMLKVNKMDPKDLPKKMIKKELSPEDEKKMEASSGKIMKKVIRQKKDKDGQDKKDDK
jgi:S1-C subfamily serine protease